MSERKYTSFIDVDNGKTIHAWTTSDDSSSITTVYGLGKREAKSSHSPSVSSNQNVSYNGGSNLFFGILGIVVGFLAFVGIVTIFLLICRACYHG